MKLLKCVGGVLDRKPVPPNLRDGADYFRIYADCFDGPGPIGPASAPEPPGVVDVHHYSRRMYGGGDGRAQVYALYALTDEEVINRLEARSNEHKSNR